MFNEQMSHTQAINSRRHLVEQIRRRVARGEALSVRETELLRNEQFDRIGKLLLCGGLLITWAHLLLS